MNNHYQTSNDHRNNNKSSSATSSTSCITNSYADARAQNSLNCINSCEFRNIEEEEDDVDSININFDDVNDQSDIEEYYNLVQNKMLTCNTSNTDINNNNNNTSNLMNKNPNGSMSGANSAGQNGYVVNKGENIFDLSPRYNNFNTKCSMTNVKPDMQNQVVNHANKGNPYMLSASTASLVDSVSENNSNEPSFASSSSVKSSNRNIHCVKEKIRRDRIKVSCSQLRKLVPNVSGFKTDMASLLETSVLWAQLINTNVPEQYLNNIKAKLASLASLKANTNIQNKPPQQNVMSSNACNLAANTLMQQNVALASNQKYKQDYDYCKAAQEQMNQNHHHLHHHHLQQLTSASATSSGTLSSMNSLSTSTLLSLNGAQLTCNGNVIDASNLSQLNLKPASWLTTFQEKYPYQLTEANAQKLLINTNQNGVPNQISYDEYEFYDKMIKKSCANSNYNYDR